MIVVALLASSGVLGPSEFVALLIVPPVVMVLVMRRGAAPPLFRIRATGAVLGWIAAWALFPVLALASYYVASPLGGEYGVFTVLAILDGVVLSFVMVAVDWIAARRRPGRAAEGR